MVSDFPRRVPLGNCRAELSGLDGPSAFLPVSASDVAPTLDLCLGKCLAKWPEFLFCSFQQTLGICNGNQRLVQEHELIFPSSSLCKSAAQRWHSLCGFGQRAQLHQNSFQHVPEEDLEN